MSVKKCNACKIEKPFSAFHKQKHGKFGLRGRCSECANVWNSKTSIERSKKYRESHREEINAKAREFSKNNPHVRAYYSLTRRMKEKIATPAWADKEQTKKVYLLRDRLNAMAGFIKYHVDHIIPLNAEIASGLHVIGNLKIALASENLSKRNKYGVSI